MQTVSSVCTITLLTVLSARAGIISYGTQSGQIPDNSTVGLAATAIVSGYQPTITEVNVTLNITGEFNGDLYVYLSHGGVLLPLLNRVGVTGTGGGNGVGYLEKGLNLTLDPAAANDVHFYRDYNPAYNGSGQLTGTWQPDGRNIDPASDPALFDSANRLTFASFNGLDPDGTWTLFIADLSPGGQSQLAGWALSVTAVPEPVNVALGFLAVAFLSTAVARSRRAGHQSESMNQPVNDGHLAEGDQTDGDPRKHLAEAQASLAGVAEPELELQRANLDMIAVAQHDLLNGLSIHAGQRVGPDLENQPLSGIEVNVKMIIPNARLLRSQVGRSAAPDPYRKMAGHPRGARHFSGQDLELHHYQSLRGT